MFKKLNNKLKASFLDDFFYVNRPFALVDHVINFR